MNPIDINESTIAEVYPQLITSLYRSKDSSRPVSKWTNFHCGNKQHMPIKCPPESWLSGRNYCGGCKSKGDFYKSHAAGDVLPSERIKSTSKLEKATYEKLVEKLPRFNLILTPRIIIPKDCDYHGLYGISPDIAILPLKGSGKRRKLVLEIDGGDGASSGYSRHDTAIGAEDDIKRDKILSELGFKVVRIRHTTALPIKGSPAKILRTNSKSPNVLANLMCSYIAK